uniref:Calcium-transporting ATPase n=1 Tax=Globisporangium ultimum (strain ATCC 200006 / CBS 805.95 / DAOM BR144) TaxID=431595 RepID=K3WEF3_GLOUD
MAFRLLTGDLIRLIETPHEKAQEQVASLGGLEGVAAALNVSIRQGLDNDNAADLKNREDTFGRNYVAPPKAKTFIELMWDAFQDITIIILTIAGVISIILSSTVGDHKDTGWIEGACIILAVFIVTVVTAVNDYQKEKQFQSLNAIKEDEKIKVIRNGVPCEVGKFSLVVGDIVRVDLGDIIPADGLVFDEKELKLDESAMTGESDLLTKNSANPFLLSGTKVMEGLGKMLVVCVGENSQAGIIKALINGKKATSTTKEDAPADGVEGEGYAIMETPKEMSKDDKVDDDDEHDEESQSPLEGKLYNLTILIGKLGTVVALLVFVVMCIRFSIRTFGTEGHSWKSGYISDYLNFFIIAITVLVVAIPEGLPLAVTIALAYSVKKMLVDNNLVRHLDACETMGSATTICSDKTGTLTTNRMTVMQIWIGDKEFSSAQETLGLMSETTKDVLCTGIAVNSTAEILPPKVAGGQPEHTGNKTECALLQFVRDGGVEYQPLREITEVGHMLTFSSAKKRMSVVVKLSESKSRIYTKGATEVVLGLCQDVQHLDGSKTALNDARKTQIGANVIEKYASQGYRTLCLSYRDIDAPAEEINKWADEDIEKDLTCIAIVGIEDPVRPEVPSAIKHCATAGITVRMVTGDNITTARSIAGKCGIINPGDGSLVMEGSEFRSRVLDASGNIIQSEFDKIWPMLRVLARSSPTDKYTLVTGLMQTTLAPHGPQVVAVTGDGTNDAPALKKANVGFAMGISGTSVAKDASDIILMDDNFNSIVNAIKWGRNVYDSIAKFLQFQLTVNVVAITMACVGAVFIEQSPLSAVQMLWVNLIMDSFASLALATEEPTAALLERKPYPKTQPLVSKKMTKHILGQSVLQLIILIVITFKGHKIFNVPSGIVTDYPEDLTAEDIANGITQDQDDIQNGATKHMTLVFNTFVWLQLFNELNARKIHDEINIFTGITKNRVFLYVCVLQVLMQIVIVQFTGDWFKCKPLNVSEWFICIGIGFLSLPVGLLLRSISVKDAPSWMALCSEVDEVEIREVKSQRGQELWVRGFARLRAQIRVIKAFKKGLEARALLRNE